MFESIVLHHHQHLGRRRLPPGSRSTRLGLALAAGLTLAGLPLAGVAATAADDRADSAGATRSGALEEVVVTARRRSESLQDVPLSVTAFSGEDLARLGTQDIIALAQTTPNMTLEVSRGTNSTLSAFIRGVGQQDPVAGFESGVGLYIDDVYLNRPQAAVLDIYDVERIEVLRGPQGTLYGRNTIGGAIKYVTRRLGDRAEGNLRLSAGSYGQMDAVASGGMPLTSTLRVGAAVASLNRDGFGDNRTQSGVDNYQKEILAGRISAEWTPSDSWFLRLSGDWLQDDSDPRQGHRLTVGKVSGAPVLGDVFDTRAGLDNPRQEVEARGASLVAEWQLNEQWTLRNILAWRDDESHSPIDFDSLPAADLDVPVIYANEQSSEELQLLYSGERLSGMLGWYYLDAKAYNAFDVILATTGAVIGLPGLNAFTLGDVDTRTWSLFGDFSWDLTETLSVAVGGRYTNDERDSRVLRQTLIGGTSSLFGGTATPIATTSDFRGSKTFKEFTPRASISWQPVPEQNLYLSYSEGFKGGGFDPRGQTSAAPDLDGDGDIDAADVFEFMLFEPETVTSVELGLKSQWLDGRLNTSVALFLANYEDVQIPGSVGVDTDNDGITDTFVGVTSNAADADMLGFEMEGQALLTDSLDLAWTLGLIDPEFNEFIDAFGADVADQREFQNTPEVTASTTLTWETQLNLLDMPGTLAAIGQVSYRAKTSQFEVSTPQLDQDSFTLLDLSLVWEDSAGHWRAGLHGKNLSDEEYKVAGYFFPTLGRDGSITAFYGNPRTVTATLAYRF